MRIESLDIHGYRRLRGQFDFSPGLTLITGPNEAGKSTLHDALIRSMFGFSQEERRRRDGTSTSIDSHPWDGGRYGITLRAHDRECRRVLAAWDFESGYVTLQDADTGAQLLHEQPMQRKDYEIGLVLTGISREDFTQVCCLHQRALETVHPSESLRSALQRAVEAAPGQDSSVTDADARLRGLLREIGVNSGHYGSLAGGELQTLTERLAELSRQQEDAKEQRRELDELVASLERSSGTREQLHTRLLTLERASLTEEVASLAARERRAQELQAVQARKPTGAPQLAREVIGSEKELRAQVQSLNEREAGLADEAARRAAQLSQVQGEQERAEAALAASAAPSNLDTTAESEVRQALAGLAACETDQPPQPPPPPAVDPLLSRYRERRDSLSNESASRPNRRALLVGAFTLAILAVAGAAALSPALLVLLLLPAALAFAARRARPSDDLPLEEFGGRSQSDLDAALQREDTVRAQWEATAEAARQALASHERRRETHEYGLQELLTRRLQRAGGEPALAWAERYLALCEAVRTRTDAHAAQTKAEAAVRELTEPQRDLEALSEQRSRPETELRELYAAAGIDEQDLVIAAETFSHRATHVTEDEMTARESADASAALAEMLAGSTLESLTAELERARTRLTEHETRYAALNTDGLPQDRAELARRVKDVRDHLHKQDLELTRIATMVRQGEQGLLDVADLEAEQQAVRARLERLERTRDAVRIAREGLNQAAHTTHRRVAPHLNDALKQRLPGITRGRYRDGAVDEDLSIKLYSPESGRLVSIEQLSRGTRDQVALIQRLEIARLLDPTAGSTPLLLDDPFAHFDPYRLELGVGLILDVAVSRQVMLFTESPEVVAAVRDRGEHTLIELPDPVEPAVPA
jgi:uncharacterized protein YhaN